MPILMLTLAPVSRAEPYQPTSDHEVLERLPWQAGDSTTAALGTLRSAVAKEPESLQHAMALADHLLAIGRSSGDPRFDGYAEAALARWWTMDPLPTEVQRLRATLRQRRHDFVGALADLNAVLARNPRDARAWLLRAVVQRVQGDSAASSRSCLPLYRLSTRLIHATCTAAASSLRGQGQESLALLSRALENDDSSPRAIRQWAHVTLAEIAERLAHTDFAQRHFEEALALVPEDVGARTAYADFLLAQGRYREAGTILEEANQKSGGSGKSALSDALLLRLTLVEKRLDDAPWRGHRDQLAARFIAAGRRGPNPHLGTEARYHLEISEQPATALALALRSWAVQREPADAWLVLASALATRDASAAAPVLAWIEASGLEDHRLASLREQIQALGS